jgi:hypothetical protein
LMLRTNCERNWGVFHKSVVPVQPAGGDDFPWLFSIVYHMGISQQLCR